MGGGGWQVKNHFVHEKLFVCQFKKSPPTKTEREKNHPQFYRVLFPMRSHHWPQCELVSTNTLKAAKVAFRRYLGLILSGNTKQNTYSMLQKDPCSNALCVHDAVKIVMEAFQKEKWAKKKNGRKDASNLAPNKYFLSSPFYAVVHNETKPAQSF